MRKQIQILVGLGCLFWMVLPLLAANGPVDSEIRRQDSLRAVRLEKVAVFRAAYPNVTVQTNPVTGVPEDIWGDISKNQTQSDPVEAAYEFFEQNKDFFGINEPREELKLDGVVKHEVGTTVVLGQYYKRVQVHNGTVPVQFSRSGKLMGISAGFAQVGELSPTPSIDSSVAIGIVKKDFNFTSEDEKLVREFLVSLRRKNTSPISIVLTIAPFGDAYHLCWAVTISKLQPPESYQYFVDAHTGQIIHRENTAILDSPYSRPSGKTIPPGIDKSRSAS